MSNLANLGNLTLEGAEPGAIYLLKSSISCRAYGQIDLLHVMSKPAGGEIRGYQRPSDSAEPWTVRTPNYTGCWPEMDAAVTALTGEPIRA